MTCQSRHRTYVIGMPIAIVWRLRGFCLLAISLMAGPAAGAKEIGRNLTRDSAAPSASLPCRVTPEKPDLGFDLRFHAAYHIRLPLKELDEVGSPVKVTITVTPARTEEAAEFVRWFRIPNIPPGTTARLCWMTRSNSVPAVFVWPGRCRIPVAASVPRVGNGTRSSDAGSAIFQ